MRIVSTFLTLIYAIVPYLSEYQLLQIIQLLEFRVFHITFRPDWRMRQKGNCIIIRTFTIEKGQKPTEEQKQEAVEAKKQRSSINGHQSGMAGVFLYWGHAEWERVAFGFLLLGIRW